jgi:hypothetical protein
MDKFYKSKNIDLRNVAARAKKLRGVNKELIYTAAEIVYSKVNQGDVIPDVALAHRIIAEAVALDKVKDVEESGHNARISGLEAQIKYIELCLNEITLGGLLWQALTKKRYLWR